MRVYLAAPGGMYSDAQGLIRFKAQRLLTSFMQATWTAERLQRAIDAASPDEYCVDSGAHAWLSSYFKKNEKPPIEKVERHLHNFVTQMGRMTKPPTFVVELDLQKIYGMSVIDAWRRDIWIPFEQRTGVRVCYVRHVTDGPDRWKQMLANDSMRYLGMGGSQAISMEERTRLLIQAYDAAKPVHGFAAVKGKWLKHNPFFSVDSTSWAAGTFFGLVPSFDSKRGMIVQRHVGRNTYTKDPKLVLGRLVSARSTIPINMLTESASGKNLSPFYQQAAEVYRRYEVANTAYWRARGLDWDAKLRAAGNHPGG